MKSPLIIHQALKDVRLLRWLLLAWVLVLVAFHGIFVYVLGVPRPDAELLHTLGDAQTLLSLAGTAAFIAIAVVLVQNDSPATTTTFWVTRPISGRAMLASKLLTALLILWVLPLAGEVLDLAVAGVDLRFLPLSRVAFGLGWLLPLMAVAAVTVGLPQFVLVAIIEVLLIGVGSSAAVSTRILAFVNRETVFTYPLIVFGVLLLSYQYLARRTRRAAVALGVAPLFVIGFAAVMSHAAPEVEASPDRQLQSVSVTADPATIGVSDRGSTTLLDVPLSVTGVPDGTRLTLGLKKAWLEAGGTRIDLAGLIAGWPRPSSEEAAADANRILKPALRGATLLHPEDTLLAGSRHLSLWVRTADLQSSRGKSPILHAEVDVYPWLHRPVATVPLRSGARIQVGPLSALLTVQPVAGRTSIIVRDARPWSDTALFAFTEYLLRDRRSNEATLLQVARDSFRGFGYATSQFATAMLPVSSTLHVQWRRYEWSPARSLDDTELVGIRVQRGEPFTRAVAVPIEPGR